MSYGWRAGTQQKIERGLFRLLRKGSKRVEQLATKNTQEAFTKFKKKPILSGYTKNSSHAKFVFGQNKMLIRFITPNDKPAGDPSYGGYAIFPFYGWSTSKKYGPRNWLKKAATLTKERLINNYPKS